LGDEGGEIAVGHYLAPLLKGPRIEETPVVKKKRGAAPAVRKRDLN